MFYEAGAWRQLFMSAGNAALRGAFGGNAAGLQEAARCCHELTSLKVQGDASQHQAGEGDKVQAGQGGGQPLVIARQAAKCKISFRRLRNQYR